MNKFTYDHDTYATDYFKSILAEKILNNPDLVLVKFLPRGVFTKDPDADMIVAYTEKDVEELFANKETNIIYVVYSSEAAFERSKNLLNYESFTISIVKFAYISKNNIELLLPSLTDFLRYNPLLRELEASEKYKPSVIIQASKSNESDEDKHIQKQETIGEGLSIASCLSVINENPNLFQVKFKSFILKNMNIYTAFEKEALAISKIRSHYSARTIVEFLRHETNLRQDSTGAYGEFKISDSFTPDMARLFVLRHPSHKELFSFKMSRTRKIKGVAKDVQ